MPYVNFIWSIWRFDILHFSYNGWFLGKTPLSGIEPYLLKLARVKVVVCPYGSDAFVIRWIRDISAQTCLLLSYPELALNQDKIEAQVRRWVKHADLCFSSLMCPDGLGRWDFITPNCITVDTSTLKAKVVFNESSGKPSESPVVIAHCPNHRGVKGTEFVIEAVNKLKAEGLNVELLLIEGMKNSELLDILRLKADILLDQLILPGYGMNATEAMALGMPVIANVGIEDYSLMYRRFSYYSQCPIISSNPETILDNLRMLITTPLKRKELGLQSRKFAEKYHSPEFFFFLFENVYRKIWNKEKVDLMRLFHPVVGTYQPREALNE
jgi:glycosyltransferase involved in cell wall biosynthesis